MGSKKTAPLLPSPADKPDAAFEAESPATCASAGGCCWPGKPACWKSLKPSRTEILATLAGLPPDWQQWHLARLLRQIEDVLAGATGKAGALFEGRMQMPWETTGVATVDKPLATIGHAVELRLAQVDAAPAPAVKALARCASKTWARKPQARSAASSGL